MFLGIIILVLGIILIFQAIGIIGSFNWTLFWGVFLLVMGIKMLLKKKHYCMHCEWFGHKDHANHADHSNHNHENHN